MPIGEKHYIVYYFVRYRDSSENGVTLHRGIENALAYIEKGKNQGHDRNTTDYQLFELGAEVPIVLTEEVTQPPAPPPIKTIKVRLSATQPS